MNNNPRMGVRNDLLPDSGIATKDRFLTAGGTQDNSNLRRVESKRWEGFGGGDGFHTEFGASSTYNSQVIYRNSYWGGPMNNGWNIYQWTPTQTQFITQGYSFLPILTKIPGDRELVQTHLNLNKSAMNALRKEKWPVIKDLNHQAK